MRAEQIELPVSVRSEAGKTASRRLRAAGKIPGVVYGRGEEPTAVTVDENVFSQALAEANWFSSVITLRIKGSKAKRAEPTVMIREVQRDLVARRLLSVDFMRISLQEAVRAQIPVVAVGESPGVKRGGILEHINHELTVECLPTDIPDHIEVDISGLDIGESFRAKEIAPPPGVKIIALPEDVVLVVAPPVRIEEVAPEVEEVEGAAVEETAEPEVVGERKSEREETETT
ncbi:MAG: 50S ribosomal protein L25 [Armatimonadota bacterium]|nr:MAG: 50S ribosomal protein L25 [Armatimonadota bacterium]